MSAVNLLGLLLAKRFAGSFMLVGIVVMANCQAANLRVVTEELPPYQIVEHGKIVAGSSYLVVQEMLRRAKLEVPVEVLPWARAYKIAKEHENVLIFSMVRNPERETKFIWLAKLRQLRYQFYSLKSRPELLLNSTAEALNYTLVSVRNSFEANALQQFGFVEGENLILTVNYTEVWQMLLKGRADFTYANELLQLNIPRALHMEHSPFIARFDPQNSSELYIAASLGTEPAILQRLQQSLLSMKNDGTFDRLNTVQLQLTDP